jgi:mRNA interferase MazF
MKRGDLYWADLNPRSGSEQHGRRPVLVVSHDGFNQTPAWRSVIVIPLTTSQTQAWRGPTAVAIPKGQGIPYMSVALCHQITTLDRAKLTDYIGSLSQSLLNQVEMGIKAAIDLK